MKEIDKYRREKITDALYTGRHRISAASLEKDFHVTDALKTISEIDNDNFDLIFAGGTSLSKAYGVLDRFSEDADIKVVSKVEMSRSRIRKLMPELCDQIQNELIKSGFKLDKDACTDKRNENRNIILTLPYQNAFTLDQNFRNGVKIELVHTDIQLEPVRRNIGLLVDAELNINDLSFEINCADIKETLAEKLVSFPRRLHSYLSKSDKNFSSDMVRHLYDVYMVQNSESKANLLELRRLYDHVITKDANQFRKKNPAFSQNPSKSMLEAMNYAAESKEIEQQYNSFMASMVYGKQKPTFLEAIETFYNIIQEFSKSSQIEYTGISKSIQPLDTKNNLKNILEQKKEASIDFEK